MSIKKKTIKFLKKAFWWLQDFSSSLTPPPQILDYESKGEVKRRDVIIDPLTVVVEKELKSDQQKTIILKEEYFDSIDSLLNKLNVRDQNPVMSGQYSSITGDRSFTGTKNWDEAMRIYRSGYYDPLEKIMKGIEQDLIRYNLDDSEKSKITNSVVGFVPNIPNTLMNLPESMINRKITVQKVKTIYIKLYNSVSCGVNTSDIIDAGIALLTAIKLIERRRVSVRLDMSLYSGYVTDLGTVEIVSGMVKLKDYTESLDLLKLCFPIVHPSAFRRFGFKYLERFPEKISDDFSSGYGRPLNEITVSTLELEKLESRNNVIVLYTSQIIRSFKNDSKKILNYINSKCQIL